MPKVPGARALVARSFTSIYFDTEDFRLAKLGITLRRRVEKRAGLWQLKLPSEAEDGRLEIEADGPVNTLPPELADLLIGVLRGRPLVETGRMRTRRDTLAVRENRQRVADVLVDRVTVLREGRSAGSFKEIEVELVGGTDEHLKRIESLLIEAGAIESDGRPKIFRVLGIEETSPERPSRMAPDLVHLHAIIRNQTRAILAHDPGTRLGSDSEDLHQLRVGIRRLRSVLRTAYDLLDSAWAEDLRAELEWIGEVTGRARDSDVMISSLRDQVCEMGEETNAAPLLADLKEEREIARKELLDTMRRDRYMALLDHLEEAGASLRVKPESPTLLEAASVEFRKLRKIMKESIDNLDAQALHKFRIQGKKARYAAELVETIVGKRATKFIDKAKDFQDVLGEHQDCVVAEARIRAFPGVTTDPESAFVAGRLIEGLRFRRAHARSKIPDAWKPLERRGVQIWG